MSRSMSRRMNEMERITKENLQLKTAVKSLQDQVDTLEQQGRSSNVEICGIPEKDNENILDIVSKVAEHVGCPILPSEIDTFYRVPNFDSSKPKPIIVRFLTKQKRDSFLGASKIKRRQLGQSTRGIKIDNISKDLFINEHLTSRNNRLLKRTKDIARSKDFKFTWIRNGCVYVRKDERSRIIKISGEEDLNKVV